MFVKVGDGRKILIVCLYVDEFEMSDLGLMHNFLGIEVM